MQGPTFRLQRTRSILQELRNDNQENHALHLLELHGASKSRQFVLDTGSSKKFPSGQKRLLQGPSSTDHELCTTTAALRGEADKYSRKANAPNFSAYSGDIQPTSLNLRLRWQSAPKKSLKTAVLKSRICTCKNAKHVICRTKQRASGEVQHCQTGSSKVSCGV